MRYHNDKGGRRPKLTDEIQRIIVETLQVGATFEAAAGRSGIAVQTIHEWRRRGRGEDKDRPSTPRLAAFAAAVEKAMADAETGCVGTIRKASRTQWQAAAWLLERRHPDRYGRADRHQVEMRAHVTTEDPRERLARLLAPAATDGGESAVAAEPEPERR